MTVLARLRIIPFRNRRMIKLKSTPVSQLIEGKDFVVMCEPTQTLEDVLSVMRNGNISSLPVFDEVVCVVFLDCLTNQDEGYLGFISVFDITLYVGLFSHLDDETMDSVPPNVRPSPSHCSHVIEIRPSRYSGSRASACVSRK